MRPEGLGLRDDTCTDTKTMVTMGKTNSAAFLAAVQTQTVFSWRGRQCLKLQAPPCDHNRPSPGNLSSTTCTHEQTERYSSYQTCQDSSGVLHHPRLSLTPLANLDRTLPAQRGSQKSHGNRRAPAIDTRAAPGRAGCRRQGHTRNPYRKHQLSTMRRQCQRSTSLTEAGSSSRQPGQLQPCTLHSVQCTDTIKVHQEFAERQAKQQQHWNPPTRANTVAQLCQHLLASPRVLPHAAEAETMPRRSRSLKKLH